MYDEKEKEKLIKKELNRLKRIYGELADEKESPLPGLIARAAFFRVALQELEEDIKQNGYTEMFQQGTAPAYERKRPAAELYNNFSGTYLKIIKQLHDMIPKKEDGKSTEPDPFEEWEMSRDNGVQAS